MIVICVDDERRIMEHTVRMCLNHTAGFPFELPGYVQMGGWSRRMRPP